MYGVKLLRAFCLAAVLTSACGSEFPLPLQLGPTNTYGRELQRSLRLLTDSPAERKRTIKVLFYGQSVTQEIWSVWLGDYLRGRFPNANLIITNLAIGYTSELLSKPASIDIPAFYPDLMIFQDYGPLEDFEKMVALARKQTTADILIQTDHINHAEDLDEPVDPAGQLPERAYRNYAALPEIARRYGAELADIRTYWKAYLRDYSLHTEDLLRDVIHPNWQGNFLMEELVKSYLREDRSFPDDAWKEAVKTINIGKDVRWTNDVLAVPFVGNRIDVIAAGSGASPIKVQIDGRRPSEFPELYHFTRTDWYPNTFWLTILKITSATPLTEEDWTARIQSFTTNSGLPFGRFEVFGSKTGYDGAGSTTDRFVSQSQRVIIEPADWLMLNWAAAYYPLLSPLSDGFEIHWASRFEGKDEFVPMVADPALETTLTLAQGLANGPHVLTLERSGDSPISGVRVYNPLARKQPPRVESVEIRTTGAAGNRMVLQVSGGERYVLERSNDCHSWEPKTAPLADALITTPLEASPSFFRVRRID